MDKDCVAILMRMYGGEDGPTKNDLMEYGDLFASFFGNEEKGKEMLQDVAVDNNSWDVGWIEIYLDTEREMENL